MIKNIIFDLGNVLLSFKPEDYLKLHTRDTARINTFLNKITRSQTWWKLDQGLITMREAENYFLNTYPEETDLLIPFLANWMDILKPIDKNIQIVKELKQNGYKLYVLSNFIKEAYEHVKHIHNFFVLFDGKILSWEIKLTKPDIRIYETLIEIFNINPQESVFLDDIRGFLTHAKKLGMKVIWVKLDTDIREKLRELNVKI
ncbi:MAG: HAD family hydrolase [Promethearchaeota archaeon]